MEKQEKSVENSLPFSVRLVVQNKKQATLLAITVHILTKKNIASQIQLDLEYVFSRGRKLVSQARQL